MKCLPKIYIIISHVAAESAEACEKSFLARSGFPASRLVDAVFSLSLPTPAEHSQQDYYRLYRYMCTNKGCVWYGPSKILSNGLHGRKLAREYFYMLHLRLVVYLYTYMS